MTQVCFADMGNPGGMLFVGLFLLLFYLALRVVLLAVICGIILWVVCLFGSKEKSGYFKKDIYIIALLAAGVITSVFIIGWVVIAYALRKANALFRERISYPGLTKETGREWIWYIAGLTAVSTAAWLAVNLVDNLEYWMLRNIMFYDDARDYYTDGFHQVTWKIILCLLALWLLFVLVRTIRLARAGGRSRRFFFDGTAVILYVWIGYCLTMLVGGRWLWLMAIRLAVKIVNSETYRVPPKERIREFHEEKNLDSWIEKLHGEASGTERRPNE